MTAVPQVGLTVWLTGLPGAGKTTAGRALVRALGAHGIPAELLDGDLLRSDVSSDLGFTRSDRADNARRASDMALSLASRGTVSVVALVSPFAADRERARARHERHGIAFIEVWVSTPLRVCERRDPKGLYRRAKQGLVQDMTGVDQPYEPPSSPDVEVNTESMNISETTDRILAPVLALLANGDRHPAAPDLA